MNPVVADNPSASRYEARIGDELAGFAEYQLTDELVVFTHTEVRPAFEGAGVGSALAWACSSLIILLTSQRNFPKASSARMGCILKSALRARFLRVGRDSCKNQQK